LQHAAGNRSESQCLAVSCSVSHHDAMFCSVSQYIAVCCSVLQCVAVSMGGGNLRSNTAALVFIRNTGLFQHKIWLFCGSTWLSHRMWGSVAELHCSCDRIQDFFAEIQGSLDRM